MQRLDLGLFWRDTVAIVGRHFSIFATLGAAFIFIPSVAIGLAFPRSVKVQIADPLHPYPLPPWFWAAALVLALVSMIGWFSIAAIAADPDEGGGRSIGATIAGVIPKIGKAIVVLLWLMLAELAVIVVLVIIAVIIGVIAAVGGAKLTPGAPGPMLVGFAVVGLATLVVFWLMTRLTPLLGVLLREPISAYAAIKRAWQLSRGSGWRIFALLLALTVVSLAVQVALYLVARATGADISTFPFVLIRSAFGAWLAIYTAAGYGILYRHLAARD